MSTTITNVTYDSDTTTTVGSVVGTYNVTVTHDANTPSGQLPTVNLTTAVGTSDFNIFSLNGAVTNFDETFGATSVYTLDANGATINSTQTATLATQNIVTIENGGTFGIGGSFLNLFESGSSITFSGANNTLNIVGFGLQGSPSVLTLGTDTEIFGFNVGTNDIINDSFVNFSDVAGYSIATNSGIQSVEFLGVGNTDEGSLDFAAGTFADDGIYNVVGGPLNLSAGAGGELSVARCFMAGTRIRTSDGEVAVEYLKNGDLVMTADGQSAPVRWIGRNTVSRRLADPLRVLPIRIRAGALAENLPARDLLLSPEHAILVDDLLIQAGALVNGFSIIRESNVPETFVYYHVELATHSLLLAEGALAESFVDNVDRMAFDNWEEHEALYPVPAPITEMSYPRALSHRQVPSHIQRYLTERARRQFAYAVEADAA